MDVENATFVFLLSWGLWLVLLSFLSQFRTGYVLLYYSLLLMILFVLVSEYSQLGPILTGIQTVKALSAKLPALPPGTSGESSSGTSSTPVKLPSNPTSMTQIIQTVFPAQYAAQAIKIATAESGLNAAAVNPVSVGGSHATGLFQILVPGTWNTTSQAKQTPTDATANTRAAYEIFKRDGNSWREWATATQLGFK